MNKKQTISLIAAIGKNRELGFKNKLLWKIPEDVEFFKKTTVGHTVVMGQKTYESIGHALPRRKNIVLTRNEDFNAEDALVAHSIGEALDKAGDGEVFIIGGGQVYAQTIDFADRLYLTLVEDTSEADTYFPKFEKFKKEKSLGGGSFKGIKFEFLIFTRK